MQGEVFWSLPGPARFLEKASARLLTSSRGMLGISAPAIRPPGMLEAFEEELREQGGGRIIKVKADDRLFDRSVAHGLARAAGLAQSGISSVSSLLDAPELAAATFIVDGIDRDSWGRWSAFLRSVAADAQGAERSLAPTIAVFVPVDLPRSDVQFLFGRDEIQWKGVVSPADTRLFVSRLFGYDGSESLIEKVAAEVVIRLAGWDMRLALALADYSAEELLDPIAILEGMAMTSAVPSWSNGLVDEWEGGAYVHTLACLARGDYTTVRRRIWIGSANAVNPFVGDVVDYFITRYGDTLKAMLPWAYVIGSKHYEVDSIEALEAGHVYNMIRDKLLDPEAAMLKSTVSIRNRVAHHRVPDTLVLINVSEAWERLRSSAVDGQGWDWPRCGQKLILMIGSTPKESSARHPVESIIHPGDVIRSIYGETPMEPLDPTRILRKLQRKAMKFLSKGESAVIDASDLRQSDRLALASMVPEDIEVIYEIHNAPSSLPSAKADFSAVLVGDNKTRIRVSDLRAVNRLRAVRTGA